MRTPQRRDHPGVIGRLLAEPHRFQFFQAMRILRKYFSRHRKEAEATLEGGAIRCRNSLSLSFPPSEIEAAVAEAAMAAEPTEGTDGASTAVPELARVTLTIPFLGLTGNQGTLPNHYTERLIEREVMHRDLAARAFLDIFTDRAAALFFRAWEKYRLHFQYETDRRERFLPLILSLIGIGSSSLRDRMHDEDRGVLDESLAYYAGVIRLAPRSAQMVSQVVQDYFQAPIRLTQFVGKWFELGADQSTRLGMAEATLGRDAFCGPRVWQRDTRMSIEVGPLRKQRFEQFLPGGSAHTALQKLLHIITGPTLEYEVRLILAREDVQPLALDSSRILSGRLGWDGWLLSQPAAADSRDAAYDICFDEPSAATNSVH
jgi:type VI secretion system protein ImpH